MEDQPLPDDALPAALSPGYVADFDPKDDPEEDPEEDSADEGDNDDDESFDDDDDYEEHEASEDDNEKEKEHPALADSFDVPLDEPVSSAEDTKAFKTDESAPTAVPSLNVAQLGYNDDDESFDDDDDEEQEASEDDNEKEKEHPALAGSSDVPLDEPVSSAEDTKAFKTNESAPTPVPSLNVARLGYSLPPIPLPSPPTYASPTYAEAPLGYRAVEIRRLVSKEVVYGIKDVWDDMVGDMEERAPTTVEGLSQRVIDLIPTLS
nr:hypothetical protein [Tanacetum cinerariifolium]